MTSKRSPRNHDTASKTAGRPDTPIGAEHRHHRRHSINLVIFHVAMGESGYAYTRNISEGGVFIETRKPLPPGTPLEFELLLDLGDDVRRVCGTAEVAWTSPPVANFACGMGVRFVTLADEGERDLREAIARFQHHAPPAVGE